jgi:hypothetical protein
MPIAVGKIEVCCRCAKRLQPLGGRTVYVRSKRWPLNKSEIRSLHRKGWAIKKLAIQFGVTERHVLRILAEKKASTWKN